MFLYGSDYFTVFTDHKPLLSLFNKPRSKPSPRIEGWMLRLQSYRFCVKYQVGKKNPADYLSRHPIPKYESDEHSKFASRYINFVANNSVPKALTLDEVKQETTKDSTLQWLMTIIRTNQWHKALKPDVPNVNLRAMNSFVKLKDELCVNDDSNLVMRQNRLVLPESLQEKALAIAHEAHLGITKTKALLREKTWFPQIDKLCENMIKSCAQCQAAVSYTHLTLPTKA